VGAWYPQGGGSGGGGSGTVTDVSSADTSIAVSDPTTTPILQLASLSTIAANEGGTVPIANGGTANITAAAAFKALAPLTTQGDIIYENATPAPARLPIGTTGQVLAVSGGVPTWLTVVIQRRVVAVNAPGATPSTDTDNGDQFRFTGLATAITSMTTNLTGTPFTGQTIWFIFIDNGTARAITWGTSFESSTFQTLPVTTVISVPLNVGFNWDPVASKWQCVAVA
jgi:hypothetical protein